MADLKDSENTIILRIAISAFIFCCGFLFNKLFIAAYIIAGYDILLKAIKNAIHGEVFDENFLMSIATIGAILIAEYPEAAMVMMLYQLGEYLQDKAIDKSKDSIESLMNLRPDYAVIDGRKINPEDVKIGDIITVNSGEKIPLDGIVEEGFASIDNSSLTGESIPTDVNIGCRVLSGGMNLNGKLKIKVTELYEESTANKIIKLIETSGSKKAKTEKFISKFAKIYTPIIVILAVIVAFLIPFFMSGQVYNPEIFRIWYHRALTFLVISCPCALVISIPLSFYAGIGGASQNGILIKGGNYLEQLSKTRTVVFDKTGTLTSGTFSVKKIESNYPDILKFAAFAESASNHPIAYAIKKEFAKDLPDITDIKELVGNGIIANFEGNIIKVGNSKFLNVEPVNEHGTIVYVSVNDIYQGYIVLSDTVKDDSENTITKLKELGINSILLTGDTKERAEYLSKKLGILNAYSELLPADKVNKLEEIINNTKKPVVFAGDGINDAPVIKRANVGIAMGGFGSDAAIEAADIVIMDDKPSKIITAINISKKTILIVKQNITFALSVKILFLILGCFGLMTMWGAVFADIGVALIAILNSLRAKNIKSY